MNVSQIAEVPAKQSCDPVSQLAESVSRPLDSKLQETATSRRIDSKEGSEAPQRANSTSDIRRLLFGPIASELRQIESRLKRELSSPLPDLQGVLNHGTQLGGKRLRPAMLLLFGKASGQLTEQHRVIATVVEMVHTATLVHDDVLDQADTRRHVPTVNAKWNEHTSILLGDYLFSQAYRLAATTSCTIACEKIGEAARLVCEGELRQVLCRDALDLDEATYVSIVAAKTGELCRVACELGTILSGASTEISAAASTFGNSLGIAFQIADDYLDLWGDQKTVGKTLGTDLEQGKMTLPLIRLLQTSNPTSQKAIRSILGGPSSERLERITPFLDASDAKDYTMECARRHYDTAVKSLACIPESEAKQSLLAIAKFSVSREF